MPQDDGGRQCSKTRKYIVCCLSQVGKGLSSLFHCKFLKNTGKATTAENGTLQHFKCSHNTVQHHPLVSSTRSRYPCHCLHEPCSFDSSTCESRNCSKYAIMREHVSEERVRVRTLLAPHLKSVLFLNWCSCTVTPSRASKEFEDPSTGVAPSLPLPRHHRVKSWFKGHELASQ